MVAPYLPVVRYNEYFRDFIVVSAGKVIAFDSTGYVVPAGLKLQAAAWKAEADASGVASADALASLTKYTASDVQRKVKNAAGVLATVGEPVVKSFFNVAGGAPYAAVKSVSSPVGVASYNYWPHPGGDGENPAQYNVSGWNLQNKIAFLTTYQLEYPLVASDADYAAAAFAGIAACVAAVGTAKPGQFVSFDANSNFIVTGYTYGAVGAEDIIGRVISVRGAGPFQMLDKVRTADRGPSELDAMPGTATQGKSDTITYSNGYGLIRILLTLK
jgi:hypothetical protein